MKIESLFQSLLQGIEQEYWQKQLGQDGEQESTAPSGSMGVMQLWKNKPLKQRLLLKLMDKSKKKMLEDMWEKKMNDTKNQSTQTMDKTWVDFEVQVDLIEEKPKPKEGMSKGRQKEDKPKEEKPKPQTRQISQFNVKPTYFTNVKI